MFEIMRMCIRAKTELSVKQFVDIVRKIHAARLGPFFELLRCRDGRPVRQKKEACKCKKCAGAYPTDTELEQVMEEERAALRAMLEGFGMHGLSLFPPVESFSDGRLVQSLDSVVDELDSANSAHLFSSEEKSGEEEEENKTEERDDQDEMTSEESREDELVPHLFDFSLPLQQVLRQVAVEEGKRGKGRERKSSPLHNSEGMYLGTIAARGFQKFRPVSSTNRQQQGRLRFQS
uniref:Uncharacterized protein n=1 Tax=Chromera velia CCMP2878 TaxID=1169474 RepID=A0A0G4HBX0_9ALVE|eukprot:Cvel_26053.t1-p1 / transcript=Cvel_26053.t1 / gene=Cvel_26053 / organism=Chromera_velia_CCMP2878 / gene_product=hypothetical protein / transcript_product=hypothetical protein / location=Cvel_scaffold3037:15045-15743(+) / protein_length=233 / sequence_SO=supercontig / SO=protein_coding / is_pseudo=false